MLFRPKVNNSLLIGGDYSERFDEIIRKCLFYKEVWHKKEGVKIKLNTNLAALTVGSRKTQIFANHFLRAFRELKNAENVVFAKICVSCVQNTLLKQPLNISVRLVFIGCVIYSLE